MSRLTKPTAEQLLKIARGQQEYQNASPRAQQWYDGNLWAETINKPGNRAKEPILKRIFSVLRWGGLFFRPNRYQNDWRCWADVCWPIATALSHGGRVMIQLPRTDPRSKDSVDNGFFNWLTDGQYGTGVCPERQGTHSTGNRPENWSHLPEQRIKVLEELHGPKHGFAQYFHASSGKSYGINLALGGNLNRTFATNQLITDNGDHGHLYLYYRPPTKDMFGGVLIGCEGEAPGHYGASGNYHSWNIGWVDKLRGHKPSATEGQFGPKWKDKDGNALFQLPDASQQLIHGPDRYDSLIVDLTSTGWTFLKDLAEHFDASMVKLPAEAAPAIPNVPKDDKVVNLLKGLDRTVGQEYKKFPQPALQLRLAMLDTYKDVHSGRARLIDIPNYKNEFDALVRAIYGN